MRATLRCAATCLGLVLAVGPVVAHHAFSAEFDPNRPVKFKGTVTRMEWINPHSWIHVDVKGPDGAVQKWMIEAGPPGALIRRGWKKTSITPGLEILVEGFQAKDSAFRANGRDITLPNGERLFAGSTGTGAPDERPEKP